MPFSPLPKLITDKLTDITPELLRQRNIRLLMLDFDNTIVPYTTTTPTAEMEIWLKTMNELEDIQLLKHMLIWTPRNLIPINDDETITMILGLMDDVTSMEGIVNVTADFWIHDDKMEKFV